MTCNTLYGHSRATALAAGALLLAATAACSESSPVDPPAEPPVFQGELVPDAAFPELAGGVVLTLEEESFEIALSLENAPEMAEGGYPWRLLEGSCTTPGDPLGDWETFPPAEPDAEGGWATTVDLTLSPTAARYVVDFRRSADDLETVLACAEVEPVAEVGPVAD